MHSYEALSIAIVACLTAVYCIYMIRDSLDRRYAHQSAMQTAHQRHADSQCALRASLQASIDGRTALEAEYTADRQRYEAAMKIHEGRLREVEDYVRMARAPSAPSHGRRFG